MELLVTERGNLGTVPFPLALLGSLRRLLASPHASGLVHLGPLPAPPASAELHAARVQAHELAQLPSEAARVRATPWFDAYVACSTCGPKLQATLRCGRSKQRCLRLRAVKAKSLVPLTAPRRAGWAAPRVYAAVVATDDVGPFQECDAEWCDVEAQSGSSQQSSLLALLAAVVAAAALAIELPPLAMDAHESPSPMQAHPRSRIPSMTLMSPVKDEQDAAAAEHSPVTASPARTTFVPGASPQGWAVGWALSPAGAAQSPACPSPRRLASALCDSPGVAARATHRLDVAETRLPEAAAPEAVAGTPACEDVQPTASAPPSPPPAGPSSAQKDARVVAVSRGASASARRLRAVSRLALAPRREPPSHLSPRSAAAERLAARARVMGLRLLCAAASGAASSSPSSSPTAKLEALLHGGAAQPASPPASPQLHLAAFSAPGWPPTRPRAASADSTPEGPALRSPAVFLPTPPAFAAASQAAAGDCSAFLHLTPVRQRSFGKVLTNRSPQLQLVR